MTDIKINNDLDITKIKSDYASDKRTRVENLLTFDAVQKLKTAANQQNQLDLVYFKDGQNFSVSFDKFSQFPANERQTLVQAINQQAAQGVGFFYNRLYFDQNTSQPALANFYRWLNSEDTIALIREISGDQDISHANAQLTRFLPGQFLTRHNDVHGGAKRRLAYVLSLNENWHPDWGGLLNFYHADGEPKAFLTPKFNSLNLFDVNHPHSVSYVTPFSGQERLAISGWFSAS